MLQGVFPCWHLRARKHFPLKYSKFKSLTCHLCPLRCLSLLFFSCSFWWGWPWRFWPTSSILGSITRWMTSQQKGEGTCFASAQQWPSSACCSNLCPASLSTKCTASVEEITTLTLVSASGWVKYSNTRSLQTFEEVIICHYKAGCEDEWVQHRSLALMKTSTGIKTLPKIRSLQRKLMLYLLFVLKYDLIPFWEAEDSESNSSHNKTKFHWANTCSDIRIQNQWEII